MPGDASAGLPPSIGRYQVVAALGRGAMGVVYRGHDPEIDRPVAIKLIRTDLLATEDREDYLRRFRQEARAAGRCTHPNIVALFDVGQQGSDPFLVMEYVEGAGLDRAVQPGRPVELADASTLILQLLSALEVAHRLGVVHRDIKPANLMLVAGDTLQLKVTDFGISRISTSELTQAGSILGTPGYMSPEQCHGEPAEARSDLFSTAVILWELLAGQRMFAGSNLSQILLKIVNQPPPAIAPIRPDLPPGMEAWFTRALAKDKQDRFPNAAAMATALRAAMLDTVPDATVALPARNTPSALDMTVVAPAPRPDATASPSSASLAGTTLLPADELERLTRALAVYMGPIAKVMVRRTAPKAATAAELKTLLAAQIERETDRQAFLKAR